MSKTIQSKTIWENPHLRYIVPVVIMCTIVYYLPAISGAFGWVATQATLGLFHDFAGIDFFGLVFFIPVLYAAYKLGTGPALLIALITFIILLPQAIIEGTYPNAMFKPTAFIIILSAVGAVVSMLQKSSEEQRQRMREMKCLFDIGRATEDTGSVTQFLSRAVSIIPEAMPSPDTVSVTIKYYNETYRHHRPGRYPSRIAEDIIVGGEVAGQLILRSTRDNPYVKKRNHLTRTLAERIGGAIREIELEQSLHLYYEQLEEEVANRTRDLEQIQEKLIRSERLSAIGELASGVGHELRNPLNVMRNCIYLLRESLDGATPEEAAQMMDTLDRQIDVSNKIVTDLMDFTRIKDPALAPVSLNDLVRESLSWITVPYNVTVSTELDESLPRVMADAEQVSRVFVNIYTNALQAIKSEQGTLDITTGATQRHAWARFKDNGCGIPEENVGRIFEPLFTTKPKGIGLGMAISRRLVEQHGGKIEVSSRAGGGTTITIKLPLEERTANAS